jgi:hypothetical protein
MVPWLYLRIRQSKAGGMHRLFFQQLGAMAAAALSLKMKWLCAKPWHKTVPKRADSNLKNSPELDPQ